jgi:hypothetical protein
MRIPARAAVVVIGGAAAVLALTGAASAAAADDYTACMRAHGLPDFPAATVTDGGLLVLDPAGAGFDPFSQVYRAAATACAHALPTGAALPAEPRPPAPPAPPQPPAPPRL